MTGYLASGHALNLFPKLEGRLLGDQFLRLIPVNPQVAARLLTPLTRWRFVDPTRQALMLEELRCIRELPDLPRDLFEVVEKSLAGGESDA